MLFILINKKIGPNLHAPQGIDHRNDRLATDNADDETIVALTCHCELFSGESLCVSLCAPDASSEVASDPRTSCPRWGGMVAGRELPSYRAARGLRTEPLPLELHGPADPAEGARRPPAYSSRNVCLSPSHRVRKRVSWTKHPQRGHSLRIFCPLSVI